MGKGDIILLPTNRERVNILPKMSKYQKLAPYNDSDEDEDSVALILGQKPPRLARFGGSEYVELENLNPEGEALEGNDKVKDVQAKFNKNINKGSKKLIIFIMMGLFVVVGICVHTSIYRHNHRPPPRGSVLAVPLDRNVLLSNGTHQFKRTTLLISLSGMHPHYLSDMRTPFLNKFVQKSCVVPYMMPSFPSETFPNHWTLITGLYPINHGIVSDTFYDEEADIYFNASDPNTYTNREVWGGEPIWTTLKKQNISTAVNMWPGADANWGEDGPDEVTGFDKDQPLEEKTAQIIEWLDREEPPQLMMAYLPNVDTAGRNTGIASTDLIAACLQVDGMLQNVMNALVKRNLTEVVNLVIVSDHGMAPTSEDRLLFLDDIIENLDNTTFVSDGPLVGLNFDTKDDMLDAYRSAQDFAAGNRDDKNDKNNKNQDSDDEDSDDDSHDDDDDLEDDIEDRSVAMHPVNKKKKQPKPKDIGFSVHKSNGLPRQWHFTTNVLTERINPDSVPVYGRYRNRLSQLYIVPEIGWTVATHAAYDNASQRHLPNGLPGYDNHATLMRAFFAATGPAFPKGRYRPFENTDLYSGLCRSLGAIPVNGTDGDFGLVPLHRGDITDEEYPGLPFDTHTLLYSSFDDFYKEVKDSQK